MAAVRDATVTVKVNIESGNLGAEQLARAEALLLAKRALEVSQGFASTKFVEPTDLHSLAVFILDGGDPWAVTAEIVDYARADAHD